MKTFQLIFLILFNSIKLLAQSGYIIHDEQSLKFYQEHSVDSSELYIYYYRSHEHIKEMIENNINAKYVHRLEIRNRTLIKQNPHKALPYLSFYLTGYDSLKSLEISFMEVDSIDVSIFKTAPQLTTIVLEVDNRNVEEVLNAITHFKDLRYLSFSSSHFDSLYFPQPPLKKVFILYLRGSFTQYIPFDTSYSAVRFLGIWTSHIIDYIHPQIIESYNQPKFIEAGLDYDTDRITLSYLYKSFPKVHYNSDRHEQLLCECYEYRYRNWGKRNKIKKKSSKVKKTMFY